MKKLLLIRHAKSSFSNGLISDFDRPLNNTGNLDAQSMAKKMLTKNYLLDAFVSSPAKRALTTANHFAQTYNQPLSSIVKVDTLYNAPQNVFFDVVATLNNSFNNVALFAHNPGITEFANLLTNTKIDDMPPCGIFAIEANINNWQKFKNAKKKFCFFVAPNF